MTVNAFFIVCLFIIVFAIGLFIGYLIGFGREREM